MYPLIDRCAAMCVGIILSGLLVVPSLSAEESKKLALAFSWPDGIKLRVDRQFERSERFPDGSASPIKSATRYMWQGTRIGNKYRLEFKDFNVVKAEPRPKSADALVQLEFVSRAVEPLLPTMIFDESAQVVELEGLDQLRKTLVAEYQKIAGLEDDAAAQKLVKQLTTDQVITLRALEDWNRMIQVWQGNEVQVGERAETEMTTGQAFGTRIRHQLVYRVGRPEPPIEGSPNAVHLVVEQLPKNEDMLVAFRKMLNIDPASFGAPADSDLKSRLVFTTDAHPETLVPLQFSKEKSWSISWRSTTGEAKSVGRTDRWTYKFSPVE